MNAQPQASPYGKCPICGENGESREKRPNGNDKCVRGHTYKSCLAITEPQILKGEVDE